MITKELEWTSSGLPCVVLYRPEKHLEDYRCGYVGVPKGHPLYGKQYTELDIAVHGGLTFSDRGDGQYLDRRHWWFGFDCAHYGDTLAFWTLERVKGETQKLARHIALSAQGMRRRSKKRKRGGQE